MKSALTCMFIDLREYEIKFFNYFQVSIKSFDELEVRLSDKLNIVIVMRLVIPPLKMLAVTLSKSFLFVY